MAPTAQKPAKRTAAKNTAGFTAEERAAMRERVKEMKRNASNEEGEKDILEKIAEMSASDRAMAQKIHTLAKKNFPGVEFRTWYGMPAYCKDGNPVFFFKCAGKFKMRYATLGFSHHAKLDAGNMWPAEYALLKVTASEEDAIAKLIKKAIA